MDTRVRYAVDDETLRQIALRVQSRIHTMIPVQVEEDSDGHTTHIKPLIKWVQRMPDGSEKYRDYPAIKSAPNNFVSGGGVTHTLPIKKGDVGFALVPSRSIDAWHEKGGTQPQIDARMHDLSDAVYVPGLRDTPRKLDGYNKDAAEMRSDDGKHRSSLHPKDGMKMSVENGKHQMAWHPKDGIKASVDDGDHVLDMKSGAGISLDTKKALAVTAGLGMNFKGAAHFDDAVTSATSFGAPTLSGNTGFPFTGIMGGFAGAMLAMGMMAAVGSGNPSDGVQRVRYALAHFGTR